MCTPAGDRNEEKDALQLLCSLQSNMATKQDDQLHSAAVALFWPRNFRFSFYVLEMVRK